MIDILKAKQELKKHINTLEKIDNIVQKKEKHMYRVSENSKQIAISLKLSQEQIQLAELIGLLHDIGRFEQYKAGIKTQKFDHGKAGEELLKKDNKIRKFIEENTYDSIIFTAINQHNKYEIEKGISKQEELFSKIVRDADKIDLIYEAIDVYWQEPEKIKEIEKGKLSKKMLEDFYQQKLADNRNSISKTDEILRFASYIYDINFYYSFETLKENNNISKMIRRFNYQIPETKKEMLKVEEEANKYIKQKTAKRGAEIG